MSYIFISLDIDGIFFGIWLEGFLYGEISVLCVPLSNEVWLLFPGLLGLYSGIFAIYLKCQLEKSRKPTIVFHALCLLYILSTFTAVCDLLVITIQIKVSNILSVKLLFSKLVMQYDISGTNNTIPSYIVSGPQFEVQRMLLRLAILQTVASGCCDFIAQCIMVHINHCTYRFIHLNLQRYTVAGLFGEKISVSLSFLHSWQLHT